MLVITTNTSGFDYDIHSLAKAFYPDKDILVQTVKEGISELKAHESLKEGISELTAHESLKEGVPELKVHESSEEGLPDISIQIQEDEILILLMPGNKDTKPQCNKIKLEPGFKRAEVKNSLKLLLYECLKEETGKSLPWGTLTGIRPTKIPLSMLETSDCIQKESEILQYMQENYRISREKGELAIDIAKREIQILSGIDYKNSYSLYIGIPFCPTTCLYCSFTSYPVAKYADRIEKYFEILEEELSYIKKRYPSQIPTTIYIGGGTPTTLSAKQLEKLLDKLREHYDLSKVYEFTVEAGRADSITEEKLHVMKRYGVNRISINPQTMNQETLEIIGRRHTVKQVEETFYMARKEGFTNINMDLILGLPGESLSMIENTLQEISKLNPDSITVHSLAIKRGSALKNQILERGREEIPNPEQMMKAANDAAGLMGMLPYYLYRQKNIAGNLENVGYAREGKHGLYNILMMEDKQDIAGIGAGTITKRICPDGIIRRSDNVKDIDLYIESAEKVIARKDKLYEMI